MKISQQTLSFLQALQHNNNRQWFQQHKEAYEVARTEFIQFSQKLLEGISKFDPTVSPDQPISDCIFRIYRDVRFSKDKTPYKTHFSAAFSSMGKKTQVPGYYFQLAPGATFLIVGIWQPDKDRLHAIRQEIDYNGDDFHSILQNKRFNTNWQLSVEDRLKTRPKGYEASHPDIELLRLKSFMATRSISDAELLSSNAIPLILEACNHAGPFLHFLYTALEDFKP